MSAEEENDVAGDASAEKKDAAKPSAKAKAKATDAKAPAAKKRAAKKPARAKKASAEEAQGGERAGDKEPAAAKRPAAKREPAGRKRTAAAKEPVAAEGSAAPKQRAEPKKGLVRRKEAGKAPKRRVVRARARYVRTSARKARMVCGHLRGKSVLEARAILAFTPRDVARDWSKLLESAVANAESNHELLEDDLIVREAYADEGPTIKRFRPRAMGRAGAIRKRTSHLTITLTPGEQLRTNKKQG